MKNRKLIYIKFTRRIIQFSMKNNYKIRIIEISAIKSRVLHNNNNLQIKLYKINHLRTMNFCKIPNNKNK